MSKPVLKLTNKLTQRGAKPPQVLYHKAISSGPALTKKVQSILDIGLLPRVPDEWKGLLRAELQRTPVVWLAGEVRNRYGGRVLQVETEYLDGTKLHHLDVADVDWWVYAGTIPPVSISVKTGH